MSFVTTRPEALAAAAGKLQGIGSSVAAQSAAAAAPTTGVIPAAADQVSTQQASIFSAYGSQYQSISAQAQAVQESLVSLLGTSASSYADTEAANAAAASTSDSGFSIIGQLTQFGQFGAVPGALNNGSLIGLLQGNMFGAAASDFFGLLPLASTLGGGAGTADAVGGLGGLSLADAVGPASAGGIGAAPVLAGAGQASAVGRLSVPPSWAGQAAAAVTPAPASLAGAGVSSAAPAGASVSTLPAGMPSVATAGRGGYGLGTPRYGVKPTVMPKPALV